MAGGMLSEMAAGQEGAGLQALRNAKCKATEHLGSASKELGQIAAQYGRLIDNYQQEINQINADIERITGINETLKHYGGTTGCGSDVSGAGAQLAKDFTKVV